MFRGRLPSKVAKAEKWLKFLEFLGRKVEKKFPGEKNANAFGKNGLHLEVW